MNWNDKNFIDLQEVLRQITTGNDKNIPQICPACNFAEKSLYVYFNTMGINKMGGVWVWCYNCGSYFHGSIKPPSWWKNLDLIEFNKLMHSPEYLNGFLNEIKMHWEELKNE